MPNVESLEQHNLNYVKDDAFEREKKAHQEHNSDDFKFLYQEDIPHGDALDKYELTSGVDIGSGTGWFANYLVEQRKYKKVYAIEPSFIILGVLLDLVAPPKDNPLYSPVLILFQISLSNS